MTHEESQIRLPAIPATLWERLVQAYYAFHMKVKPDVQRVLEDIERIQKEFEEEENDREGAYQKALDKLDGYTKSCIESIAAETNNWRLLFDTNIHAIENLEPGDQLVIMKFIFESNRNFVRQPEFKAWIGKQATVIFDELIK